MDLISRCIETGNDMFLREVFLNLKMNEIKTARSVHSSWDSFISNKILRNPYGYSIMQGKLEQAWVGFHYTKRTFTFPKTVKVLSLAYGDEVYASLRIEAVTWLVLDVENLRTKEIFLLYESYYDHNRLRDGMVQLYKELVAALTGHKLILWKWKSMQKLFEADFDYLQYTIILKQKHLFVMSEFEGLIILFKIEENSASQLPPIRVFSGAEESLLCLDSDESWLATGGTKSINIWDIGREEFVNKIDKVYVTSLVLHYPFAISVGNDENLGVSIWNLLDCSLIRKMLPARNLYPVISNKYILCVTDGPSLFVYNLKDALNENVSDKALKKHVIARHNGKEDQSIHINDLSILTCHLNPCPLLDDGTGENYEIKIYEIVV